MLMAQPATYYKLSQNPLLKMQQSGAELCKAQAQLGWHVKTTTTQNIHLKSSKLC
jgi:hypothetical protein